MGAIKFLYSGCHYILPEVRKIREISPEDTDKDVFVREGQTRWKQGTGKGQAEGDSSPRIERISCSFV